MKKNIYRILLATAILFFSSLKSQESVSFQKNDYLLNSESNLNNGVPDIGFPLINIAAASNINVGVSLSYSTEGVSAFKMISDVGRGWSLQYGGGIYKNPTNDQNDFVIDDITHETSSVIYYYNFLGNSGRFYIGKDEITDQLVAVPLEPTKNKIVVTKNTSVPNKVSSFTIIDENGNSYGFNKINVDKVRIEVAGSPPSNVDTAQNTRLTNSAFLLSSISNNRNQEVATFEYETTTELISQYIGTLQENKIKKITVNNYGSIVFVYAPNSQVHSLKNKGDIDWYQMDRLILKDKNDHIISQYAFSKDIESSLAQLTNLDKNNNIIQRYSFDYNRFYGPGTVIGVDAYGYVNEYDPCSLDEGALKLPNSTNPKTAAANTLKSITLPTGGRIEYEFESNAIKNENSDYCLYNTCFEYYDLDKIYTWNFDNNESGINNNLNFPTGYKGNVFVKFSYSLYPNPPHKPGVSDALEYDLYYVGDHVIPSNPYINSSNSFPCTSIKVYDAGEIQNIKKALVRGTRRGYGTLEFYAVKEQRKHQNKFGYGLRVRSIKNYNAGATSPSKWITYDYNAFSDPSVSSGEIIEEDLSGVLSLLDTNARPNKAIGYFNVKVTDMLDNSYSKYTFYNAQDFYNLTGMNYSFIDFGGYLKRKGLLKQKEVFGVNNTLLQESTYTYQPETLSFNNIKYQGIPIQKVFIKKQAKTVKNYINGSSQALISSGESIYENHYNNLIYSKEVSSDGMVTEKNNKYAYEKNNQKLLDANMVGMPLENEIKNDGKIISKAETRLDDPSTLYPTSILSYNINNQNSSKKVFFNSYDQKGNLREFKSENGIPAATVWGYHQTQPIAKITGVAYADIANLGTVAAAIAASDADDNDPSTEPALLQALDNLRKEVALKAYQMETFTYDPLIGITSRTFSNGLKETYFYDSSHRISKVLDQDGKVIKTYDYHYSPQLYGNDSMGDLYVTNNCSAGFLPNRYMYVVPANKYFSFISKDEANQQALQDISSNGQNTANQTAGCTPLTCTITKGYGITALNSASLTMPDPDHFRLQMSFPYDTDSGWYTGKSIGKMQGNCLSPDGTNLGLRAVTFGQWSIVIYPNGNMMAKLPTNASIPVGSTVNIDVTFPIEYTPEINVP